MCQKTGLSQLKPQQGNAESGSESDGMSDVTVNGAMPFLDPIEVLSEILGARCPITVAGYTGDLVFPCVADEQGGGRGRLALPGRLDSWELVEGWGWGRASNGYAHVHGAMLEFSFPFTTMAADADAVERGLDRWQADFHAFVEIETRQKSYARSWSHNRSEAIRLTYDDAAGRRQYCSNGIDPDSTTRTGRWDFLLSMEQLHRICRWCSDGKAMSLEYDLLLQALRANRSRDYRRAVADAGSAAEVALTKAIRSRCAGAGHEVIDALIRGHKTLGNRIDLAEALGVEMPLPAKRYGNVLTGVRNKVMHEGYLPADDETFGALDAVHELLRKITPDVVC